jgi:peroxiredoxin
MADESMAEEDEAAETDEEMAEEDTAPSAARPAWQQLPLTDARTGETFTLADFAGKAVFVEPMATWCSNCRRQLHNVSTAMRQIDTESVVFVALSVETNISAEQLAAYAENEGFDWTFAVATPELIQALVGEFGQAITNPPSTPHFVIRPDGSSTELVTGIEPSGAIASQIEAALQ